MPSLVYPKSSTPGARPGEGAGRLVNVFTFLDGEEATMGPAPGLVPFALVGSGPRGFLRISDALLYVAVADTLYSVNSSGTAAIIGNLPGASPVTMARNNRPLAPDVVIIAEGTPFITNGTTVSDYPDPDVGSPTSVTFLDGYFIFTYGDGTIRSSGLNTTDINDQAFTKAEAKPDGAIRGIVKGSQFIALGPSSAEFYSDTGTIPFPFTRTEVVDTGLFGQWAVAGFEDGWDRSWFMVASDRTVGRWDGYTFTRISTRDVERSIAGVADPSTLRMVVYAFAGNAVVSISGPMFTWDYHVASGLWFERESDGLPRWRARCSVNAFGRWIVGDTLSSNIMTVSEAARTEADAPLVCTMDGRLDAFPNGVRLNDLRLDISTGQGRAEGETVPEGDPCALISWSLDAGGHFSAPVRRSIGRQGEFGRAVTVGSLGRSRGNGVTVRTVIADPVPFVLKGASVGRVATRKG